MKPASHLVVHPSVGHFLQRQLHHLQGAFVEPMSVVTKEKLRGHWLGKLRRAAESAVQVVKLRRQLRVSVVHHLGGQRREAARHLTGATHLLRQLASDPLDFALVGVIRLAGRRQQPGKTGHTHPVFRGEIGAAIVRPAFRSQEHRHRPTAAPCHHLHRFHVHRVQVGTFLAVHLDVHEVLVHQGGDVLVFKGFPLHHVAPVAGRIANAQQDGPILFPRPVQRIIAPGIPVHRVLGVL